MRVDDDVIGKLTFEEALKSILELIFRQRIWNS